MTSKLGSDDRQVPPEPDAVSDLQDRRYMAHALQLAQRGLYSTDPNPRVGCVLVKEGRIIGEGWHQRLGGPHAEVHAIGQAGAAAAGATAYVTLEPCSHHGRTPPCADALVAAAVARVVVAMADPNPRVGGQGLSRLRAAGIETSVGVLETEAESLNPGFLRRMREGRPWIRLKVASSVDGRTAMKSGESQWITGQPARADVQRLRARSSAIVTGIGTVLGDNPMLTIRPSEMGDIGNATVPERQPCRVILDSRLRLPPEARILGAEGEVVVLCRQDSLVAKDRVMALQERGARVAGLPVEGLDQPLSWAEIQRWLGAQTFNEILIEAGPTVAGSALAAGVVDEFWLYQAPTLLGSEGRPVALLPFDRMSQQFRLQVADQRRIGEDTRTIFRLPAPYSG
jgi:diaminohydroxyphosphoribosylaminopyrimidine deaminase/5-amino-6-(5-phosphoribosylamino)uracil reductase